MYSYSVHLISVTGYWYLATATNDFCTTETALLRSPALEGHPRNTAAGHPFPNGKAEAELVLLAIATGTEGWKQNWSFKIQHTYQLASGKICLVDYKAQSCTSFFFWHEVAFWGEISCRMGEFR